MDHRQGFTMIYDLLNHSLTPPKKTPHLSYTHYEKVWHEFVYNLPSNSSSRG